MSAHHDSGRELDRMLGFYLGKIHDEMKRAYPERSIALVLVTGVDQEPPVVLSNLVNSAVLLDRALQAVQRAQPRPVT